MKKNENTKIIGKTVVLVPYKKVHVPKYHAWMQSEELRELTASEELTLDEEYRMQETWHNDDDKCTFIVLDRDLLSETGDEVEAMIGDTNLFILESSESAEAEIMVAEESARGKGRGKEAVLLMLKYGSEELLVKKFVVKIGASNKKSISLFLKIGFDIVSEANIFNELTMEKIVTDDWKSWLQRETQGSHMETYMEMCNT